MSNNPGKPMPRWRCHKEVFALKIASIFDLTDGSGGARLEFADDGYAPLDVERSMMHRYIPQAGDYLVVYADGYRSISPAKAFEEGYSRIT